MTKKKKSKKPLSWIPVIYVNPGGKKKEFRLSTRKQNMTKAEAVQVLESIFGDGKYTIAFHLKRVKM